MEISCKLSPVVISPSFFFSVCFFDAIMNVTDCKHCDPLYMCMLCYCSCYAIKQILLKSNLFNKQTLERASAA